MNTPAPAQNLTWLQAVDAARRGHVLRRKSDIWTRVIQDGDLCVCDDLAHAEVTETGQEGFCLAAAWTHDNKPVTVFLGAASKRLFVPDSDDLNATDWVIET